MAFSIEPLLLLSLRATQTLLSLTALILCATTFATTPQLKDPSPYIYALICSTITLLTLTIYYLPSLLPIPNLPTFPTRNFFLWDFVLAVLWAALAGVFGMIHLHSDKEKAGNTQTEGDTKQGTLKAAIACDLVVMVCWVVTAGWGCTGCCKAALAVRRLRKEHKETEKMLEGQERGFVEMEQESDGVGDCEKGLMGEGKVHMSSGEGKD